MGDNLFIKNVKVIDTQTNVFANNITACSLTIDCNATVGNISNAGIIVANVFNATSGFYGTVIGSVNDVTGDQVIGPRQPSIENPDVISSFTPGLTNPNVPVPLFDMPALGPSAGSPVSADIPQDSVEHLLLYNQQQLREEVMSLRSQVVMLLDALRTHGLIDS